MKTLKQIIPALLIITFVCSCSTDESNTEKSKETLEYKAILNVSYGNDSNQVYDIYLPKNRTLETKIMLLVHGGGWVEGDKADMNGFKDFIRAQLPDIAVVNINYRLADATHPPYPMQINDITSIINSLKEKQADYQIGTELGFMGISAGGHLSLLWSYAFDTENKVKMVCSMVGPTNLLDEAYPASEDEVLRNLFVLFGNETNLLKTVSPIEQAKTSSPPTLLFYGEQDPLILVSQGVDLDAKLTQLGVVHEFTLYPNGGHGWVGMNLFDTSTKLKAFMEAHL